MTTNQTMGEMSVGPHEFARLGKIFRRSLCARCYEPREAHPVGWVPARPMGDKRKDPA